MITCNDCGQSWPGTQSHGGHCTKCHINFANNSSFDRHIVGADRVHTDEDALRMAGWTHLPRGWARQAKFRKVWG